MIEQIIKPEFYKKVEITKLNDGRVLYAYLFKFFEYWNDDKDYKKLFWIGAYSKRNRANGSFIVESGAGITEKRMKNQILSYFKQRLESNPIQFINKIL